MAQTRRILKDWFISTLRYAHRGWPWIERGNTQEIEWPYRKARWSVVVRFPFTLSALVIGRWGDPRPEEEALLDAVQGNFLGLEELDVRD